MHKHFLLIMEQEEMDKINRSGLNRYEPSPIPNNNIAIWDLVKQDIEERNQAGIQKYGTPLQAFNGRNPLIDAYQEALDLVVYLRQAIEENVYNEN